MRISRPICCKCAAFSFYSHFHYFTTVIVVVLCIKYRGVAVKFRRNILQARKIERSDKTCRSNGSVQLLQAGAAMLLFAIIVVFVVGKLKALLPLNGVGTLLLSVRSPINFENLRRNELILGINGCTVTASVWMRLTVCEKI